MTVQPYIIHGAAVSLFSCASRDNATRACNHFRCIRGMLHKNAPLPIPLLVIYGLSHSKPLNESILKCKKEHDGEDSAFSYTE